MNITLPNYKGVKLKTAGKYHSEDITLTSRLTKYAGEYEVIKSGFTVTIVQATSDGGAIYSDPSYYIAYSTDGGSTWLDLPSLPATINNVSTIMFKNSKPDYNISAAIGSSNGDTDIARFHVNSGVTDEITLTSDVTWYGYINVSASGGAN